MDADCAALAGTYPSARAKISNDLFALPGHDGRSALARRYRDLVRGILDDMGLAPGDPPPPSTRETIRTLALLQLRLDKMQARSLARDVGSKTELSIVRTTNTITRLRWALGIGRRKRQDLGPIDYAETFKVGAE
jgi:hypothetical protein